MAISAHSPRRLLQQLAQEAFQLLRLFPRERFGDPSFLRLWRAAQSADIPAAPTPFVTRRPQPYVRPRRS